MRCRDLLIYLVESPSMVSKADLHEVDDPSMINTMVDIRQYLKERTYGANNSQRYGITARAKKFRQDIFFHISLRCRLGLPTDESSSGRVASDVN